MTKKNEISVAGLKLIKGTAVQAKTTLSRTTIWRMVERGEFPAPCPISPGRVAWYADEVEAWIAARVGK